LRKPLTLLLGHTDSSAATTGCLGVLSTNTEAPVVTETTVSADLLQALEIVTELAVDAVGEDLAVLAIDDVALPVEEPAGDLVCGVSERNMKLTHPEQRTLEGVLDNGDDTPSCKPSWNNGDRHP
jgi:hypothetical protein